jgi:hypothetical protein
MLFLLADAWEDRGACLAFRWALVVNPVSGAVSPGFRPQQKLTPTPRKTSTYHR